MALTFAMAGVASANNGPHGGYSTSAVNGWNTTDGCAACHRAHTGETETLLAAPSITALCQGCHDGAYGASTDVFSGTLRGSGKPLNGGGFMTAVNVATGGTPVAVTSRHNVDGLSGVTGTSGTLVGGTGTGIAYGGGDPTKTSQGVTGQLECTSCHNPHGSQNYRILNGKANYSGVYNQTWATGETALWQANNVQAAAGDMDGSAPQYAAGNHVTYDRGISDFCATCHTNYVRSFAGSRTPTGQQQQYDWNGNGTKEDVWRHAVSMKAAWDYSKGAWDATVGTYAGIHASATNPNGTATPGTNDLRRIAADGAYTDGTGLTCLTCHYAHGTSAASSAGANKEALTGDSALLFLDNRGVCQQCHQKGTGK